MDAARGGRTLAAPAPREDSKTIEAMKLLSDRALQQRWSRVEGGRRPPDGGRDQLLIVLLSVLSHLVLFAAMFLLIRQFF